MLRAATEADLPVLYELDQLCFPIGIAYSRAELSSLMRHPSASAQVACAAQAILGFAIVRPTRRRLTASGRFQPALHLITIDVAPTSRRRRIGASLMEWALERARTLGLAASVLEVATDNRAAMQFYERFGFVVTGEIPGYYGGKCDALTMERIDSGAAASLRA